MLPDVTATGWTIQSSTLHCNCRSSNPRKSASPKQTRFLEQYPDSKWSYYYDSGGLYDQAHSNAAVPDASTTSLAQVAANRSRARTPLKRWPVATGRKDGSEAAPLANGVPQTSLTARLLRLLQGDASQLVPATDGTSKLVADDFVWTRGC